MERLGAVDLALASRRRAGGAAAARRMAGVSWRLGERPGTRVRVRRCQGAGQVALDGSPGPLGRGRAVDEVHRRRTAGGAKQSTREERDGGEGLSAISKISMTSR